MSTENNSNNASAATTARKGPSFPIAAKDCEWHGNVLEKIARDERAGHALDGFRVLYPGGEQASFGRACPALNTALFDFARCMRDLGKSARFFKNMNGELAVELTEQRPDATRPMVQVPPMPEITATDYIQKAQDELIALWEALPRSEKTSALIASKVGMIKTHLLDAERKLRK